MIKLKFPTEPYDIEIADGITFTVKPVSTIDIEVARAVTDQKLNALANGVETFDELGISLSEDIDVKDPISRAAIYNVLLAYELGFKHIIGITGVQNEETGEDVEPSEPVIRELFNHFFIKEKFIAALTAKQILLAQAKED